MHVCTYGPAIMHAAEVCMCVDGWQLCKCEQDGQHRAHPLSGVCNKGMPKVD